LGRPINSEVVGSGFVECFERVAEIVEVLDVNECLPECRDHGVDFFGREGQKTAFACLERFSGAVRITDIDRGLFVDELLLVIERVVSPCVVVGHERESAGVASCVPSGGLHSVPVPLNTETIRSSLMLFEGSELRDFTLDLLHGDIEPPAVDIQIGAVVMQLNVEIVLCGMEQVAAVEVLDSLFKADGDEQADADGCNVDEEVFPAMRGFVGCVDVEHGDILLGRGFGKRLGWI
jgi:hypothetical protein